MMKLLSVVALFISLSQNTYAASTEQSLAKYNEIVETLEFWNIPEGSTPVYYGEAFKNGGHYQCLAIAFVPLRLFLWVRNMPKEKVRIYIV